jgi:2-methylcitrate dehydratase PrpD
MARGALRLKPGDIPESVSDKVKIGLLDMLSCALEARNLPWGCQAIQMASRASAGVASIIGTRFRVSTGDAAFVNATLGHGLVREDMHTGAVSHLGVVIYPALLACAQRQPVTGRAFILAAACGYEIGAALGKALVDADFVRFHRPTGTTGPIGAALAGSLQLGLDEDATVSAIGLAANTAGGLNEWPYAGGDEMFFHPGFAARNAITAVELAELGAFASETALDGRSGLFAALQRNDRIAAVTPFQDGKWEILSVYYKPAPACNYAQTACQAALVLAAQDGIRSSDIETIRVRCSAAAAAYPGCDYAGPYGRILQAKMSIQYCVAATLAQGKIAESNYHLPADAEVMRLVNAMTLEAGDEFTASYPAKQGAEVTVRLRNGETYSERLIDVVPATPGEIRARFRAVCKDAKTIENFIDDLENQHDAGVLGQLLEGCS